MVDKEELLELIREVLYDTSVDVSLKHKIAKEGRMLRDNRISLSIVCLDLSNILTGYLLRSKSKTPISITHLYHYVLNRGQRYKSLATGITSIGIWM